MTDDEDDTTTTTTTGENFSQPNYMEEHYNCMTLREQLQEFPGRVPPRKKKTTATVLGNPQQQQHKQHLHRNKPKVREEGKRMWWKWKNKKNSNKLSDCQNRSKSVLKRNYIFYPFWKWKVISRIARAGKYWSSFLLCTHERIEMRIYITLREIMNCARYWNCLDRDLFVCLVSFQKNEPWWKTFFNRVSRCSWKFMGQMKYVARLNFFTYWLTYLDQQMQDLLMWIIFPRITIIIGLQFIKLSKNIWIKKP